MTADTLEQLQEESTNKDVKDVDEDIDRQTAEQSVQGNKGATTMDMDAQNTTQFSLVEIFASYTQEEQKAAIEFLNIPKEKRLEAWNLVQSFVRQACSPKRMTSKDMESARIADVTARYVPFPENKTLTVEHIMEHFKSQLGNDLKYFGANDDRIYLDELRAIEPQTIKIYQTLFRAHQKNKSVPLMKDLICKKSKRITKELETKLCGAITIETDDIKTLNRLIVAQAKREERGFYNTADL